MNKETTELAEDKRVPIQNEDPTSGVSRETPDKMTDSYPEDIDDNVEEELSFQELYEQSLEGIQEGKVTNGEIVGIDGEFVLVDIGYKSEGQIRVGEFMDALGNLKAKIGDRVGKGVVFIPFHYKEASANELTNSALDPISKIAEAKVCAVSLEKAV